MWEGDSTETSATITGLASGDYSVRLCVQDAAGNTAQTPASTVTPTGEADPPVGDSFTLNRDAATTQTRDVFLTSEVSDESGVSEYCVTEVYETASDCRPWLPYDAAAEYELSGGAEEKTVRVWFLDPHGNVSKAAEDTILFDWLSPRNGTAAATVDGTTISLSWSGFTEDVSSIAAYVVVRGDDYAPESCAEGEEVGRGLFTELDVEDLAPGRHGFRVCAVDAAGNISSGDTVRATVEAPETPPIVVDFSAAGGATTVCDRDVELRLTATGASDITRMCIDKNDECRVWIAYNDQPTWRLSAGAGTKTLHAWV